MKTLCIGILFVAVTDLCFAWTTPETVTELASGLKEQAPFISSDGLTIYFGREDSQLRFRMHCATRSVPYGPFTDVYKISQMDWTGGNVASPWVSPDNLRMYFMTAEQNSARLRMASRDSVDDPWSMGTYVSELNTFGKVESAKLTPDELTIIFDSTTYPDVLGSSDLYIATRPDKSSPFGTPRNLSELNTISNDFAACLSPDALTIYFNSRRSGELKLYSATRESVDDLFGPVQPFLPELTNYTSPCFSSDGNYLYLNNGNTSNWNICVSSVPEPASFFLFGSAFIIGKRLIRRNGKA